MAKQFDPENGGDTDTMDRLTKVEQLMRPLCFIMQWSS
jgi:hypothetical protein